MASPLCLWAAMVLLIAPRVREPSTRALLSIALPRLGACIDSRWRRAEGVGQVLFKSVAAW